MSRTEREAEFVPKETPQETAEGRRGKPSEKKPNNILTILQTGTRSVCGKKNTHGEKTLEEKGGKQESIRGNVIGLRARKQRGQEWGGTSSLELVLLGPLK